MNFLNLLVPKEKIVGIEITDEKLRMLYLEKDALGTIKTAGRSEEDLEEGAVEFGAVKDRVKFSKALAGLRKKFKPQRKLSNFAIITIPQNGVYSETFDFPKDIASDQMMEAIGYSAAANLPLPLAECYLDWQVIEINNAKKKVLISLIPKKTADAYIEIFKENNFNLIALEPYFLSIARSVEIPDSPIIFLNLTTEGITSIVYNKRAPYFSQFEFWSEASQGQDIKSADDFAKIIKAKVKKTKIYFESQHSQLRIEKARFMVCGADAKGIIKAVGESEIKFEEAKTKIPAIENCEWAPAAGAAMRAFVPRSEDTIISLLPVGTEDFYEIKKAESFAGSIQFLTSALVFFYALAFLAAFIITSITLASVNEQLELRSGIALPADYNDLDLKAKEFNSYVKNLSAIQLENGKNYAEIIENMGRFNTKGISLTNISINSSDGPITVSGTALSRTNLNGFKFQLENSNLFTAVKFSIQNIAQQENISFVVNLYSKK